jgi:hypothetical protein
MTDERKEHQDELTEEELEETNGEPLPDREVMSTVEPPAPFMPHPVIEPGPPPSE